MTPKHEEYELLNDSLNRIIEVGNVLNENKRTMENQTFMTDFFKRVKYANGIKPIEIKPSRKFVRFGLVDLVENINTEKEKLRKVYLIIFNDLTIICKVSSSITSHHDDDSDTYGQDTLEYMVDKKKSLTVERVLYV